MAITQNFNLTISSTSTFSSRQSSSLLTSSLPFPLKTAKTHFFGLVPSRIQLLQQPLPSFSRRLFLLCALSGISDASTDGENTAQAATSAISRGMLLFREGDVSGSLAEFDKAIELDSCQKANLWQRGISLYYLDRFEEGAEQFRTNVTQNPTDTMESIWCFLCEAQLYGVDGARNRLLKVGSEEWPVLREAYKMFKYGGDPEKLLAEFSNGADYFFASLYAGFYYESQNEPDAAKVHIIAAYESPYGQRSDYTAAIAKVHCLRRNWISG